MQSKYIPFSQALEALKAGHKISRLGWNGNILPSTPNNPRLSMYVVMQRGYPEGIAANKQSAKAYRIEEGATIRINPYFSLRGVDGSFNTWVPSISDLLAEDWEITEE